MFNGTSSEDIQTTRRTPTIHRKIDGPMLLCSNGEAYFLTLWDRFKYKLGRVSLSELETKYRRQAELKAKYRRL